MAGITKVQQDLTGGHGEPFSNDSIKIYLNLWQYICKEAVDFVVRADQQGQPVLLLSRERF